jgi:chemotaxis protein MotB
MHFSIAMWCGCGVSQEIYLQRTTELDRCQSELTRSQGDLNASRQKTDELAGESGELRDRLTTLETDRFKLSANLSATKKEMEQLRKAQALSERRVELYYSLREKLAPLITDKSVAVEVRKSKLVLTVSDEPLFDPGKADLKPKGLSVLRQLAAVLKGVPERDFLVAGHTDNQPLKGSTFRSGWDLTTARAVAVVRALQGEGVDPRHLAAAGYSEFDYLSDNSDAGARSINRRIEVVFMPSAEELPAIDLRAPARAATEVAPPPPPAPTQP